MSTDLTIPERAAVALGAADGNCKCGCSEKTPLCEYTDKRYGLVKGRHLSFVPGHQMRGNLNGRWNGGSYKRPDGYVSCLKRGHPKASSAGRVLEHVLIAEAALGKHLPPKAEIHHIDEQGGKINPRGLVICPDSAYHKLLHSRSRALNACGNANWRKCKICKNYDSPSNLHIGKNYAYHNVCNKLYQRNQKDKS